MSSDSAAHTVLIADDERDTVDTTAVLLEGSGYRVLRAYSRDSTCCASSAIASDRCRWS